MKGKENKCGKAQLHYLNWKFIFMYLFLGELKL